MTKRVIMPVYLNWINIHMEKEPVSAQKIANRIAGIQTAFLV
jgi:hypothetical protein